MARIHALLALSTNILEIPFLADGQTGSAVSGATVVATILDAAGVQVAGQTWPVTLDEDPVTSGRYSAVLEPDLEVTAGDELSAIVTATAGPTIRTFVLAILVDDG
jgi:hypothetical protein